jgi:hypothetical protein
LHLLVNGAQMGKSPARKDITVKLSDVSLTHKGSLILSQSHFLDCATEVWLVQHLGHDLLGHSGVWGTGVGLSKSLVAFLPVSDDGSPWADAIGACLCVELDEGGLLELVVGKAAGGTCAGSSAGLPTCCRSLQLLHVPLAAAKAEAKALAVALATAVETAYALAEAVPPAAAA